MLITSNFKFILTLLTLVLDGLVFYHFPASQEVAKFFNKGSFIETIVYSKNELKHKLLGKIKGNFVNNVKKGQKVKLLIQPEDLEHSDKSKLKFKNAKRKIRMRSFKAWKVRQKLGRNIKSRSKILILHKRSKNYHVKMRIVCKF